MNALSEDNEILQTYNLALLALNDLLIDSGVIEAGAWGGQLRRYRAPADRSRLQALVTALGTALDARHFRSASPQPPVKITWDIEGDANGGSSPGP